MEAIKNLKKYFPVTAKTNDVMSLVIAIVIYVVASAVVGAIAGLLWWIPVIGWLLGIISTLAGIYCLAGIVLAVLDFLGTIEQ